MRRFLFKEAQLLDGLTSEKAHADEIINIKDKDFTFLEVWPVVQYTSCPKRDFLHEEL